VGVAAGCYVSRSGFLFHIKYVHCSMNRDRSYSVGGAAGSAAWGPQISMQVRGVGSGWTIRQPCRGDFLFSVRTYIHRGIPPSCLARQIERIP